jgi:HlyD family secretion protein
VQTSVFRKSSLERLSSPEQLDRLIKVTTPTGWIVLWGLLAVLLVIVGWSIVGSIAITVEGHGMLMKSGGLLNIQHMASGMIKEVKVNPGDIVHQGDVVARIDQIDIVNRINETKIQLKELEDEYSRTQVYSTKDLELQRNYLKQQEANIIATINSDSEQLKFLEEKVRAFEDLQEKGGISKQQVIDTQNQYSSLERAISENQNKLRQVQLRKLELSKSEEQEVYSRGSKIDEVQRTLKLLESELAMRSDVVSPYTGRVIEVVVNEGTFFQMGTTLISIEPVGRGVKNLEAVVFVSVAGGNLKPGMEVQVSPLGVKKEEYGYMIGRVTAVSEYPVSAKGMMAVLGNETLVQNLVQLGPVFKVNVDLVSSSRTPSGKKWSSSAGPPFEIQSGTMCIANIIENRKRPISLVIPYIRKKLGI